MAGREYDYIKGSTAVNPSRKSRVQKPDKKYKEIQRRKIKRNKNILLKHNRKNDRKYMLTVVAIIFGLGCITISGDTKVYRMQSEIGKIDSQIKQTQEANEALKVTLLKFASLNNVQEKAKSKLSMLMPGKEQSVKIDFSQNYFESLEHEDSTSNTEEKSLLSKLKDLIK